MPSGSRNARKPPTFKFKNVGPVADADLELGDLTIIAGRNNTGKTYLVYTLYGFLQMWHTWPGAAAPYAGHGTPAPAERGRRRIFDELVECAMTALRSRSTGWSWNAGNPVLPTRWRRTSRVSICGSCSPTCR